jgi:hypothetical protein
LIFRPWQASMYPKWKPLSTEKAFQNLRSDHGNPVILT